MIYVLSTASLVWLRAPACVQEFGGMGLMVDRVKKGGVALVAKTTCNLRLYLAGEVSYSFGEKSSYKLCDFLGLPFYVLGGSGFESM